MYVSGFYKKLVKPKFLPDGKVFVRVWSILYFLMFVSFCLVITEKDGDKNIASVSFFVQLALNIIWPFVFFGLHKTVWALAVAILLSFSVGFMVFVFYDISKLAGILQIPYFLWSLFAIYLNAGIVYLNKKQRS